MKRKQTTPGEMLLSEFLEPGGISIEQLSERISAPLDELLAICRDELALNPTMALRLAAYFGNSPEFWLALQTKFDLWNARQDQALMSELAKIPRHR